MLPGGQEVSPAALPPGAPAEIRGARSSGRRCCSPDAPPSPARAGHDPAVAAPRERYGAESSTFGEIA